ncbi:MAG: ABC transporter ATP-binding protein [Actinomycetota bacterium]|nr:ABC transporter ATP-binding protein [Actinomycetota bacterium]
MPAVDVQDLVVHRGPTKAVAGLDLRVEAGEVVAVLGPNGAGKTTTVETLEGYHRPTSGTARVLGLDPVADHRRLRARIGVMLQRGGIWPGMGPAEALRLFSRYYDHPADPHELLRLVDLESAAKTPWRRLSGGEQQRLALALALVGRPEVAFLDEPTAGVDPRGRRAIRDVIAELRSSGAAVLLTTHELDEAQRVADRMVIVDGGKVVASGSPAEMVRIGAAQQVRFGAAPGLDVVALGAAIHAAVSEDPPGEYVVDAPATPRRVAAITTWLAERDLALADLRAGRERLEDVFLRLTSEPTDAPSRPSRDRRRRRPR